MKPKRHRDSSERRVTVRLSIGMMDVVKTIAADRYEPINVTINNLLRAGLKSGEKW